MLWIPFIIFVYFMIGGFVSYWMREYTESRFKWIVVVVVFWPLLFAAVFVLDRILGRGK